MARQPRKRLGPTSRLTTILAAGLLLWPAGCVDDPAAPGDPAAATTLHKAGGLDGLPTAAGASALPAPRVFMLGEFSAPEMRAPDRIAIGPLGDIVVSDPSANRVHVLTGTGRPRFHIHVEKPLAIEVDGKNVIYVGSMKDRAVHLYDAAGTFMGMLGSGLGEVELPGDIAWEPTRDRLHVTDSAANVVKVYEPGGAFLFKYGGDGTGDGQMRFPTGITVDPANGRVYVGDHANARVHAFDVEGTWIDTFGSFGNLESEYTRVQGMALDALERLYVVDTYQARLQIVDPQGAHVAFMGTYGNFKGQLNQPMDAAMDGHGRLLVTNYKTKKITVFGIEPFEKLPKVIEAEVSAQPSVLDAKVRDGRITLFIETATHSAADIDPRTIRLEGVAPDPKAPSRLVDVDGDGLRELMVKLPRAEVLDASPGRGKQYLLLTAALFDGRAVEGDAKVTVLDAEGK